MHESGTVMSLDLPKPPLALQRSIVAAAHAANLRVVAHATCLADTLEILSCGVDGLTHTFLDRPPTPDLIAAYQRNNAHCNPTLAAMASGTTEGLAMQERFAHDPRVQRLMDPEQREGMCVCMAFAREGASTVENCFETVRRLKAAGVPVIM
jgi:imidazolonepropionase-like amidohydrolase